MSDKRFIRLGDIADVKVGLQTSDNQHYLRKRRGVRGSYEIVDASKLLSEKEISNLTKKEQRGGVDPKKCGGRHFLPYDKGGESDSDEGWLPNYHVPTQYFIDWSMKSVDSLAHDTVADIKRRHNESNKIQPEDESRIASRFQNSEYYFREGISFSPTGIYSPTFRLGSGTIFGNKGSTIFFRGSDPRVVLGVLTTTLVRYLLKCYVSHTVETGEEVLTRTILPELDTKNSASIKSLVNAIIEKQKVDPRYPYQLHEQKEIERLVYEFYGLREDDICEVELWYCRRYQRLAIAQGVMAEVREKYKDHLSRAQRILEKPSSYWRSHPILTLLAQDEGAKLEFKETLEADTRTGASLPGLVHSVLKTVAAFLNADGGTLLIGVSNSREIKGLQRDLALFGSSANYDKFELKLRHLFRDRLDPNPLGRIKITFEDLSEGDVCRIDVEPQPEITHVDGKEVYVRDGNRTEKLEGRALTRWIRERTLA